jgi:hypothetical protein
MYQLQLSRSIERGTVYLHTHISVFHNHTVNLEWSRGLFQAIIQAFAWNKENQQKSPSG